MAIGIGAVEPGLGTLRRQLDGEVEIVDRLEMLTEFIARHGAVDQVIRFARLGDQGLGVERDRLGEHAGEIIGLARLIEEIGA